MAHFYGTFLWHRGDYLYKHTILPNFIFVFIIASDCDFKLEGYGYTGSYALKNLPGLNEEVCKYECSITNECAGVTFRTSDGYCFMKKQVVGAAQKITMQNSGVTYRHWNKQGRSISFGNVRKGSGLHPYTLRNKGSSGVFHQHIITNPTL
jgi:hypothetical protein